MKSKTKDLVSIIMPAYNCEQVISQTIESVLAQSYTNWELIIVDDGSTDRTLAIIQTYANQDARIKLHKQQVNGGAAHARNTAIDLASGRYLAFLDSDDLWVANKIEKQITFMQNHDYSFTCTSYMKIDEQGNSLNRTIHVAPIRDYEGVLKTCPGNSTVIYDAHVLGKFKMPNLKNRQDYVMWLNVVKKAQFLYGIDETLGSHRIRKGSLSNKKLRLLGYHWKIYRQIEQLPWTKSLYLLVFWVVATVFKLR
jgi:teichuronic acid biosynthesis glycosyltransferase TuaG